MITPWSSCYINIKGLGESGDFTDAIEEKTMNYRQRITINSSIRSGKPCIINTRITVNDILDYLGGGMTIEEVLDDFPDLTLEDIQACFAFAADRDRRLMIIPDEITVWWKFITQITAFTYHRIS